MGDVLYLMDKIDKALHKAADKVMMTSMVEKRLNALTERIVTENS